MTNKSSMTDKDYIKKAVELANDVWPWDFHKRELVLELSEYDCDALTAQLVKQADATKFRVISLKNYTEIMQDIKEENGRRIGVECLISITGAGRAMNTIKAIVDSKILEAA